MKPVIDDIYRQMQNIDIKTLSLQQQQYHPKLMRGLSEVQSGILTKNKEQIQNALACTPDLAQMITTFSVNIIDISLTEPRSIGEYLTDIKSGVCRHFALIAKMLYTKLQDRITLPTESELIYV